MIKTILVLILTFTSLLYSQDNYSKPSVTFSNLRYFYGVTFNPTNTEIIFKTRNEFPKDHPLYEDDFGFDDVVVIKTKIREEDNDLYYVILTEGVSADPGFYLINVTKPDSIFCGIGGEHLVLPGNGYAYVEGRTNNEYQKRRKYKIDKKGFIEVKQPFYYIGLKSHTIVPIMIYKEKNTDEPVAKLPASYEVEVILTDDNSYYLIKTPFGLLGWLYIPSSLYPSKIIEGIYIQGD